MTQETLYKECPLCAQTPVIRQGNLYNCPQCGLSLKEHKKLGLFGGGKFTLIDLGQRKSPLAEKALKNAALPADTLKIVLSNIYSDPQLAEIAGGKIEAINPVKTVLAQIILEQLNEACYIHLTGLRRGHGPILPEESWYYPDRQIPDPNLEWQDEGNLFCTTQRLVLPSQRFTFIRLDRKVTAIQAYLDGVAIQRRGEDFATYFAGCYAHEAALVAAYVMGRVPALRPAALTGSTAPSGQTGATPSTPAR